MKEHFWKERGIYYRTNEMRPERTTLVFIHGMLGSSSAWREFENAFDGQYNLLGVDLRGYGKSLKPVAYDAFEIENIAGDVVALIDHLGIRSFIPISHSAGTLVAVALLRMHPQGAAASIFISPIFGIAHVPLTKFAKAFVREWTRILQQFNYATTPGKHIDYSKYNKTGDWSPRRILADLPNDTPRVFLYFLDHVYERDFDPWWKELTFPMLIVHGNKDSISPLRQVTRLAEELPHAKLVVIDGANHIMPLNRFSEVKRVMEGYLAGLATSERRDR